MTTERGTPCPCCKIGKTQYVALVPITRDGVTLQPHEYSVCAECYRKQWEMTYGKEEECPV